MRIIDIHTHGIRGCDTTEADPAQILAMAAAQGSHGVSEILPTIFSGPTDTMRSSMDAVRKAAELQKNGNLEGAVILGVYLEGPFLNPLRCGALDPASFLDPTDYNFRKLLEGFQDLVKIVAVAPEIGGAVRLIKTMTDRGIIVTMGHSDATFAEAEAGFNGGAKGVTHLFNAMRGFHHREPGIAGFGLLNPQIYVEAIADPYHLHSRVLDLIFRIKNPDRIILISDSVKDRGKESEGYSPTDGRSLLSGGSMTVTESARRLIDQGFSKETIMACISENPATYLEG
jgi:N-acetylglucosamine-6-phosphate deacetylase